MRADRLLEMMLRLQTQGKMTATALATALGVSRRTILRDVEALSLAGIPIYAEGGHGGGIALDEGYRTSLTGLNETEIRSLFVGNYSRHLQDLGFGEATESARLKLMASVPPIHQAAVEHIRQRILIDPDWWFYDHQLPFWEDMLRAVYGDWCIQGLYENHHGERAARVLEPYGIVAKSSIWYLVARPHVEADNAEFRTFRLSRFHTVEVLSTRFERRPDFDLSTYWQQQVQAFPKSLAEFHCTLQIRPSHLNFIRWLAPGRYQVTPNQTNHHSDEWLTLDLQFETIDLAKMLVFGLGDGVKVLSPSELQESVIQTAQTILQTFHP